jgi:hypothetical protein
MTGTTEDQWKETIDAVVEMLKKLAESIGK